MKLSEMWSAYVASPTYAKDTGERRRNQVEKIWGEFADAHDGVECADLTSEMVAEWLDARCDGCSPKTYDDYLRIIRQVINAVLSKTGLVVNVAMEVPVRKKRSVSRKPYTKEQVAQAVELVDGGVLTVPYHYRTHGREVVVERPVRIPYNMEVSLTILLGAYCGLRLGDAVAVRAEWWDGECLTYTPSKTLATSGMEVVVPVVHPRLKVALDACRGELTPDLRRWHERCPTDLCRLYRRIFEACGFSTRLECEGRRDASTGGFHALRHSYVTWCAEAGVPIDVVASCVGHTSTLTTRIYHHVGARRKAVEMARLMTA